MEKLDLKQKYHDLYAPPAGRVVELVAPRLTFLMIDGAGDPNGPAFQEAVQALYTMSYTLHFWTKKHPAPAGWQESTVAPLEGLWSVPGVDAPFAMDAPRSNWRWTAMIMQPAFVTPELIDAVRAEAQAKKPQVDTGQVRLEAFEEGRSVQIMHIGPYAEELPSIQRLDAYMAEHDLVSNGRHHEVYLGDPRRTDPAKLKTVLRHPVRAA